jgi:A/G-specific adenine glycosylase
MFTQAHTALYDWYRLYGRHDLPWRNTDDPYRIWISEIMLQQTQVKTVLERFYFPFLEAFPTLSDLAAAELDHVLKRWEGLGYYTRARNLHRAARLTAPAMPQTVSELQALPGIGKSTAHAIAAFAYHTPVPIMDANVRRILCRLFGIEKATEKRMWEHAHALFDAEHPFDYNQAMMDLGSMLCTPKAPECDCCPLASHCRGQADPLAYPEKTAKKAVPVRRRTIVVRRHGGRFGMRQRTGRFLHGLWGFAEYDDFDTAGMTLLGSVTQKYSHFTLEGEVFMAEQYEEGLEWFALEHIPELALSGADRKVLGMIGNDTTGNGKRK